MSVRCRFGYHRYLRVVAEWETYLWGKTGTNTVCLRCGERSWFNYKPYGWLTEAEWSALPPALMGLYEASDESTIWYRPRTTEPLAATPNSSAPVAGGGTAKEPTR